MEARRLIIIILCALIAAFGIANGGSPQHHHAKRRSSKSLKPLFVFGDSYADTGNTPKSFAVAWFQPYGFTFPGKPSGRFSSGRVLTDFLARFLAIKTPITYKLRKRAGNLLGFGMNFAVGGTGVLDTYFGPNMTSQIDLLEHLVGDTVFSAAQLNSSVALLSVAGNDYRVALNENMSFEEIRKSVIPRVVNQLVTNLKRVNALGIRKVVATALPPMGCIPLSVSGSSNCNSTENTLSLLHNSLLKKAVEELNLNHISTSTFILLDLYGSFMTILNGSHLPHGLRKFKDPSKQCCKGNPGFSCSDRDEQGKALYRVCSHPEASFFWDSVHPTEAGWLAVFSLLQDDLEYNLFGVK